MNTTVQPQNIPTHNQAIAMALADARKIRRSYRRGGESMVALREATCTIFNGDRIALVGRSGSGKSTLLHLLGGLDVPSSGELTWPLLGAREDLRPAHVALVFQMPSLIPSLTVIENVELPLLLQKVEPARARSVARDALCRVELESLAEKLPEELSGGQAQRVAVARTLAGRPRLILADEPTGQLDRPTAQHLFDVLLAALAGASTALVVATHDRVIAERLDTIWQMRAGVLEGAER